MSRTLRLELAKRVQRPSNQMPIRNSRRSRCLFPTGADGVTATDPETLRFKYQLQLHPKNRDVLSKKPHPDLNPVRCRWSPNGRNTDGFGSSYEETRTSGAFFWGGACVFGQIENPKENLENQTQRNYIIQIKSGPKKDPKFVDILNFVVSSGGRPVRSRIKRIQQLSRLQVVFPLQYLNGWTKTDQFSVSV